MHKNFERLLSVVFVTVSSDTAVVVLLHKHFSSWLSIFYNSNSIIMNCMYTNMSESNATGYVNNSFTFFKLACYISFLFNTNCLSLISYSDCSRWCWFMFLTRLGNKSQYSWPGNYTRLVIISSMSSVHIRGWWRDSDVTLCYPPADDKWGQITLNRKLLHKLLKWYKFSSHVKGKSLQRNRIKPDVPLIREQKN
jgi:hypothetical protein